MALFFGFSFSMIGLGYLIYGKRAMDPPFMVFGLILMIYPYVVRGALGIAAVGVVVSAAPFVMRRLGW